MTGVCPVNIADPFNESSVRKMSVNRCTDFTRPLVIDCSVEYELPNSAKPPVGNKNEPLLMIHPSYYRREESKRRSQFINNLPKTSPPYYRREESKRPSQFVDSSPKRRRSSRLTRWELHPDVENCVMNYEIHDRLNRLEQEMNSYDRRRNLANHPSTRAPVPSATLQAHPNFDSIALQARTDRHYDEHVQFSQPLTNACTAPEVHQLDLISTWRQKIETDALPKASCLVDEVPQLSSMRLPEQASVPLGPMPHSASIDELGIRVTDYWASDDKYENYIDGKYHHRTEDRTRRGFCDNKDSFSSYPLYAKPLKKRLTYMETVAEGSVAATDTGARTFQRQPAVGIAAIAAPSVTCCPDCNPTIVSGIEDNRHFSIDSRPWTATTAPDFPPTPLPMNLAAEKRSSPIVISSSEVSPELSVGSRTLDSNPWWNDEYDIVDLTTCKGNRADASGNAQIDYSQYYGYGPVNHKIMMRSRGAEAYRKTHLAMKSLGLVMQ